MPMRITFELSDRDLSYLRKRMAEAREAAAGRAEHEIAAEARRLLDHADVDTTPVFMRDRIRRLGTLVDMLGDEEFGLAGADRKRILQALAYFAEPLDVIPDAVPGLGFLDDAILAELVVRETKHEIEAYEDFCHYRKAELKKHKGVSRADYLKARRKQLHGRMRRRRRSQRSL